MSYRQVGFDATRADFEETTMPHFITNTIEELVLDIVLEALPEDISGRQASCPHTGCWGHRLKRLEDGYREAKVNRKASRLHRLIYEHLRDPIPDGLVLDHLCRNTGCCNPDHLESVTGGENTSRGNRFRVCGTQCPKGHAYTEDNLYTRKECSRYCRACQIESVCRRRSRKKAQL
jgi:hypothetical protein